MTTVHAVGDLVLERSDTRALLAASRAVLRRADVVVGHLEIPHLREATVQTTDVPAIPGPPEALDGVADAGFGILTLAGNHVYDFGAEGMRETVRHATDRGIATCGVGETLDEAFAPAVRVVGDHRVGVLSVNAVGPRETWASGLKPGAAYVEVITHYADRGANPGGPPGITTWVSPASLERFTRAVRAAAAAVDLLIVAIHKGLVHTPAELADYERPLAHAAVEAGAHAVIGHHAHILRGVEMYRGRAVFHGLGNFATVTSALNAASSDAPERARWALERRRLFGFEPDAGMPDYPFHPQSRNTAIAVISLAADGKVAYGIIPCWIDDAARPTPTGPGPRGEAVVDYLRSITSSADLNARFEWDGDRLTVADAQNGEL
ncbi:MULTISPECIES: CapA family protein [unclassified Microbacterium]|uniref:CapA family protein n=1 Tax=unclassified Microbacterium TaxID=2609290 RepID=UPI00214CDB4B|nr:MULTISPECIES: CapA family protein [unclassified Microbacterium]MCR2786113.1 CapA family protein [Microbacterium sp. zg.B96]WIM17030.1 CapA family protein [Microbacterium sp. zg-B96]